METGSTSDRGDFGDGVEDTPAPIRVEDVERAVAELQKVERYALTDLFLARSRQTGDGRWRLLSEFAGMALHPERPDDPFTDGSALPILWQDVGDDLRDWLRSLAEGTTTPWLKARLCDVVWVRWRDHLGARAAVAAYLDAASIAEGGPTSHDGAPLSTRAIRLAAKLNDPNLFASAFARVGGFIASATEADDVPLARLLEALAVKLRGIRTLLLG